MDGDSVAGVLEVGGWIGCGVVFPASRWWCCQECWGWGM